MSNAQLAREALQQHFGFTDFREGQAEVIESVLAGRDTVVVMPTGGGKSLCYQLPALMLDGVTLVVSPLIALMKDQVDQLAARNIASTFINSSISYGETNKRLSKVRMGEYKLVYVAPERFRSQTFMDSIAETGVRLFAVDEAHCISHWGHDFRPDYLRLKEAAHRLGRPQIIALTATATPQVRADISEQLGITDPHVSVAGFDRPNLALRVLHTATEKEKLDVLKQLIRDSTGSGIIYAATRKSVEQISAKLKLAGLSVELYHGGMDEGERSRAQDVFMGGKAQAIVATNAFGMGIDKSDIRFVAHFHLPGSIEAYYQEVGRAGRDGLPADCVMLFNYADTRTQQFFIEGSHPSPELISRVYKEITSFGAEKVELSAREIAERVGVKNDMSIYSALVVLEKAGHIERGRPSDATVLALMKAPVDEALGAVSDESTEGAVMRDLVFSRNVNEREQTELEVGVIGSALGLSDGQVRRALGALASRGLISCHNAYQGRGIRLLDESPARALRIDTKDLAARAAAEQWKLRKMIDFCYHKSCLRRFILNYFGDRKHLGSCGTCSVCAPDEANYLDTAKAKKKSSAAGTLSVGRGVGAPEMEAPKIGDATALEHFIIDNAPAGETLRADLKNRAERKRALSQAESKNEIQTSRQRPINEAESIVVKKILSCIARIEKDFGKNKFGKGTVAAVLRGSTSKQVRDSQLDKLSTYGLLRDMVQDEITAYIKALIQAGCIAVQQGMYPTVSLTDFGRDVMTSRAEVTLELPD
ncbi:MAG TPA: RecQ family ATP-dependent DNA helicase [Blastocatellia bacterium]|nr:RecQ family ATP-dependent DNA helicase [Blastocatellia bacterium]